MYALRNSRSKYRTGCEPLLIGRDAQTNCLFLTLLLGTMLLISCGGGASGPSGVQIPLTLSGNWQFTMAPAPDGSFSGGPQGGFLLQQGGTVTGGDSYAVYVPGLPLPCSNGSGTVSGSITGKAVSLTVVAGTQTFTLSGNLSTDSTTMAGTYTSTAGTAADGSPCGTVQAGLQWSALAVQPLTGAVVGGFHSTGGNAGLNNQDFAVTGALTQGSNTGGSSATITGTLSFINPATNQSDYPCFATATVTGQISGSAVALQLLAPDGTVIGQIGEAAGSYGSTGVNLVTFDLATGGTILQGIEPSYMVATSKCSGSLDKAADAGDFGNICFGVNGGTACTQPITLTPATLTFPSLAVGKTAKQTIALDNASNSTLNGLTIALVNSPASGVNFSETDNCGPNGTPSNGEPFSLISSQQQLPGWYCTITIIFAPACTTQCGSPLTAALTVNSPVSADSDTAFTVPITGTGVSGDEALYLSGRLDVHGEEEVANPSNRFLQSLEHHAEIY